MSAQDILSEINTMPNVGGTILFSRSGRIIAKRMGYSSGKEEEARLLNQMMELLSRVSSENEGFLIESIPGKREQILCDWKKNLVMFSLIYPGADPHFVKLNLDIALGKLVQDKAVLDILNREFVLPVVMWKKVSNWDVVRFNEYLEREGIQRGIVITKTPYDEKVEMELAKHDNKVEIIVHEKMKDEFKRLNEKFDAMGYAVKKVEGITDRWL